MVIPYPLWKWGRACALPWLALRAFPPAFSGLFGPPGPPLLMVSPLVDSMLGTPGLSLLGVLRGWLCRSLHCKPLRRLLDLRLDAGEVGATQGHHDFLAVQSGFERDTHWCLWQWCRGTVRLRWLAWCLSLAVGGAFALR